MLKTFVWLHRWLGIVLCLFFAIWFASGAVLLFVPFPALDGVEARNRAEPLAFERVHVAPRAAMAQFQAPSSLRLISVLGEPVYVAATPDGDKAVSARTGEVMPAVTPPQAIRIAGHFAGAAPASVAGPFLYDQWVVHQAFDHARPLYRVALADRQGTELYVSARTGEVVQKTRSYERAWNWVGAVVHWIYFVPLRRFFSAWDQTVWWVSLVGLAMTGLGIGLGIYRTLKKMGSKQPAISPFKGWLRWHHILGLCGGAVVLTWIFSGWLSMDHGRLFSRGAPAQGPSAAYAAVPLAEALDQTSLARLRALGSVTSVRFAAVQGRLIEAGLGPSPRTLIGSNGDAVDHVPIPLVTSAVQAGWPKSQIRGWGAVTTDDFYAKAEGLPIGTQKYHIGGRYRALIFVNPQTGEIAAVVDRSRAAYDCVYYALHSFNFPGLLALPTLRAVIVLPLLALGFALCITSIVVGIRRLRIVTAA